MAIRTRLGARAGRAARLLFRTRLKNPVRQGLLDGKLDGPALELAEMLTASWLMAIAAGVQFLTALEFLPVRLASLATFIFAFATPVWSTASRAMWNHTPALLMLSVVIYLLVLARRDERYAAYASIPLELAFMMRPGMAFAVLGLSIFVFVSYRRQFMKYCLLAVPLAVLFFSYNLSTRGELFQSYFANPGVWPEAGLAERFGMQLISPSRGLFVFCPVVLFSFAGIWLAWRQRWLPLAGWLAALVFVQIALVTKYNWPGYCYGPRYFTETVPLFTFFLIPVIQRLREARAGWRVLFGVVLAWSVFVQARGATTMAVHRWNDSPVSVDVARERVWDWGDAQFCRGLH